MFTQEAAQRRKNKINKLENKKMKIQTFKNNLKVHQQFQELDHKREKKNKIRLFVTVH